MMGWRDKYKVHPAADVFPMMSDEELKALGENIKSNGLKVPTLFWRAPNSECGYQLIDGRNRLEAMERAGIEIPVDRFGLPDKYRGSMSAKTSSAKDPASLVIGLNIHRRHLTKQERADLIVAAFKATEARRQLGEVPKRHVKGKAGSEKDAVKAAAVAAGAEHGISERTVERSFAKAEGKTPKPKASPEEIVAKRKATREANIRARRESIRGTPFGDAMGVGSPSDDGSWQRLSKVLVRLGSEHEGERQAAADAANRTLQPMGWRLVMPDNGEAEPAEVSEHMVGLVLKEYDPVVLAIRCVEQMDAQQVQRLMVAVDEYKLQLGRKRA
jgi:hypothetical protein